MISVREEHILNELNSKGTVSVRELSKILQCSEVTIRNDIKRMEEKELLIRKHGKGYQLDLEMYIQGKMRRFALQTKHLNISKIRIQSLLMIHL